VAKSHTIIATGIRKLNPVNRAIIRAIIPGIVEPVTVPTIYSTSDVPSQTARTM
jgi:hypothetical protein